jgi:hypothetical protein
MIIADPMNCDLTACALSVAQWAFVASPSRHKLATTLGA